MRKSKHHKIMEGGAIFQSKRLIRKIRRKWQKEKTEIHSIRWIIFLRFFTSKMSGFVSSVSWFYHHIPKSHKQKEVEGVKGNWNPRCVITKIFQEHFILHCTRRTICCENSHRAATMNWPSISPIGRKEEVSKEGR